MIMLIKRNGYIATFVTLMAANDQNDSKVLIRLFVTRDKNDQKHESVSWRNGTERNHEGTVQRMVAVGGKARA